MKKLFMALGVLAVGGLASNALCVELVAQPGKRYPVYKIDGAAVSSPSALNVLNDKKRYSGDMIKIYLDDRLTLADFDLIHGLVDKAGYAKQEYFIFRKGDVKMVRIERGKVELLDLRKE